MQVWLVFLLTPPHSENCTDVIRGQTKHLLFLMKRLRTPERADRTPAGYDTGNLSSGLFLNLGYCVISSWHLEILKVVHRPMLQLSQFRVGMIDFRSSS